MPRPGGLAEGSFSGCQSLEQLLHSDKWQTFCARDRQTAASVPEPFCGGRWQSFLKQEMCSRLSQAAKRIFVDCRQKKSMPYVSIAQLTRSLRSSNHCGDMRHHPDIVWVTDTVNMDMCVACEWETVNRRVPRRSPCVSPTGDLHRRAMQ